MQHLMVYLKLFGAFRGWTDGEGVFSGHFESQCEGLSTPPQIPGQVWVLSINISKQTIYGILEPNLKQCVTPPHHRRRSMLNHLAMFFVMLLRTSNLALDWGSKQERSKLDVELTAFVYIILCVCFFRATCFWFALHSCVRLI